MLLADWGIQLVEDNLIEPLAMSAEADLHPFVTLFSVLLFGTLFGFLGVLLAIPLALLIWSALQVFWVEARTGDEALSGQAAAGDDVAAAAD